jgi:hypothetical protein
MAGKNTIAKTGRESLDLRFDLIRHIRAAVERNMTVRPERVLAARRARFVEQTLLRNQHERTVRNFAARNFTFIRRDFVNVAAEMNCSRLPASSGFPWDRFAQRIIDFENSRRVPKSFQSAAISPWQFLTGNSQKFPGRNVQKNRSRFREIAEIIDTTIYFDFSPKLTQMSGKRVRNLL